MSDSELRTPRYYKQVPDFARDKDSNIKWDSLSGAARLEAAEQHAREKAIAIEETKILREQVRQCYRSQGVNHLENCKDLVKKYASRLATPDYGILKVSWQPDGGCCGA